ncbi:MAG: ATP synthase F0 subunit C [Deltaproteobacteria bacterium]|nr:ATP synthase F0 subunit C [Deltaproteobacteria bacterium]MBW1918701.1 ATP synthase F0 subunit C [Deltaproteobacteria bacterium]MBW1936341.1 ATP synthase F0 subunit C [Deltaproteobacteria bacterium]RLB34042.1 MAG: ATP synthase F0 subunit C [Deltaproteobacteria bacterium]
MLNTATYISASSFLGAALAIGFGAIGAAVGEGYAAGLANQALSFRPEKSGDVLKNMLVGQAIAESAAIFALVVAILLLFSTPQPKTVLIAWAAIGAGLSMGLSAIGSGVGAGLPAGSACVGIVRQPQNANKVLTTMLIGSAVCQTPAIFGMVIAFLLLFLDFSNMPVYPGWAALLGAGLATGLAAGGPGVGNGLTSREAVTGVARNPEAGTETNRVMLIGLSVGQSTAIYGFLISLLLVFTGLEKSTSLSDSFRLLGAGLSSGFGGIGPGVGLGVVAAYACKWVARRPEATGILTRTMLVGMAVTESTSIYALIVALLLVIVF